MMEFDLTRQQPTGRHSLIVSVLGIGGAGANVLDTIALDAPPDTRLVVLNTDVRALQNSMAARKVQLGRELTQGLGAGGDPELGAEAARASEEEIRAEVRGAEMVFLCAGLGGGTGSGAAPLVARIAREEGAFVVVFAMMPFAFEGRRRLQQATEALNALRQHASALIAFDNDRIGELVLPKKGIQDAFAAADRAVSQSIQAIVNLVTQPGLIRIGMDDLVTALRNHDSRCLFGFGQAAGEERAATALKLALKSPLLSREQLARHARSVLVHVCGGPSLTFFEVQQLMTQLSRELHPEAHVLFGTGTDERLGDQLSVTILTSLAKESTEDREAGGSRLAAPVQAPPARAEVPSPPVAPAAGEEQAAPAQEEVSAPEARWETPEAAPEAEEEPVPQAVQAAEDSAVVEDADAGPEEDDDADLEDGPGDPALLREPPLPPEVGSSRPIDPSGVRAELMALFQDFADEPQAPPAAEDEETPRRSESSAHEPVLWEDPEPASGPETLVEAGTSPEGEPCAEEVADEEEHRRAPAPWEADEEEARQEESRSVPMAGRGPTLAAGGLGARPHAGRPFQSWAREEARRQQLPPQEPERVPPVSDFDEPWSPPPAPSPEPPRPERPAGPLQRLINLRREPQEPEPHQPSLDESLQRLPRGRFEKAEPTIEGGQNLDIPTFLRRKK